MNGNYLIPANSKKSLLIFGVFKKEELIMFSICLSATLIGMVSLPIDITAIAVLTLAPALIGGLLVMPIPNYHNVLTMLKNAYTFMTIRQKFIWKGWCFLDDEAKK